MARSLRELIDRMTRRRWIGLCLIVLAGGVATRAIWPPRPALSPVERAIVGEWGRAETDPSLSFAARGRGLMSNPWIVQEFADDHTYRQWLVSADDTRNHFAHVEGRWRVVDGTIRFEGPRRGVRTVLENAGTQIERVTGIPLASSSTDLSAPYDIPFRLASTDHLELTFRNQDRRDWQRLSGSFKDHPRLSPTRPPAANGGPAAPRR